MSEEYYWTLGAGDGDGDNWHGPCDTREEALAEGTVDASSGDVVSTGLTGKIPVKGFLGGAWRMIEAMHEVVTETLAADHPDEAWPGVVTKEQEADLVLRTDKTVREWLEANGIALPEIIVAIRRHPIE